MSSEWDGMHGRAQNGTVIIIRGGSEGVGGVRGRRNIKEQTGTA